MCHYKKIKTNNAEIVDIILYDSDVSCSPKEYFKEYENCVFRYNNSPLNDFDRFLIK
jgi:hypothetical protein